MRWVGRGVVSSEWGRDGRGEGSVAAGARCYTHCCVEAVRKSDIASDWQHLTILPSAID